MYKLSHCSVVSNIDVYLLQCNQREEEAEREAIDLQLQAFQYTAETMHGTVLNMVKHHINIMNGAGTLLCENSVYILLN